MNRTSGEELLAGLRPSAVEDRELEWFFNMADCDLGLRSNFEASLAAVHAPGVYPRPEDCVKAAHGYRRILGAFWIGLKREAEGRLAVALREYSGVRGPGPCVVRGT